MFRRAPRRPVRAELHAGPRRRGPSSDPPASPWTGYCSPSAGGGRCGRADRISRGERREPVARHRHGRPRARATVFDVLAAGLLLAGVAGFASARLVEAGSPPVRVSGTLLAPTTARPPAGAARRPDRQATASEPRATPIELSIPAIGVRTSLVRLSLNSDGTLQVPTSFSVAGWYALGPSPGQTGAAVIVGHVDSRQGPGVFYGLGELAPGSV